ncbi:MAG: EAL domain-containing protein [Gammaproteobacteria bacterium]|nr:EAL domain-containing protein [Gammaproteobacteria bacterium]
MFKLWSIRNLLQLWSFVTVFAVISLASIAIYSNQQFSNTQKSLTETVLPLENASRQMSEVAASFVTRQKQLVLAHSTQAIDKITPRQQLEQEFEKHWQTIASSVTVTGLGQHTMSSLFDNYQQFLVVDSQLSTLILQDIATSELMQERIKQAESIETQFQQKVEAIVGRISLQLAKEKRANSQSTQIITSQDDLNYLKELAQSSRVNVLKIINLTLHVIQADNVDLLLSLRENDIKQYRLSVQRDIAQLARALSHIKSYQPLIVDLDRNCEQLITIVIGQDNSIYDLRLTQLRHKQLLTSIQQESITIFEVIVSDLARLSAIVNDYSEDVISQAASTANKAKWLFFLISIFILVTMVRFVIAIPQRITSPLAELRTAMHALSIQQFDKRLTIAKGKNEIYALAKDFNTFADNNQRLIDDLASAKDSLQVREQHITAILNGVPEAILTLNSAGIIKSTNPEATRVLHAEEGSLEGLNLIQFFAASEKINHLADIANSLQRSQEFAGLDYRKQPFLMWLSLNPLSSLNNDLWVCVISDITARKQAEQNLIQTSTELDTILENAMVGIAFLRDRVILRVNHKFEEIFACDRDQVEGKSVEQIFPSREAYDQLGEQAYTVLQFGENYEGEVQLLRLNGEKFWCSLSSKAIDPKNPGDGSIWLYEDITIQREKDEKLLKLASLDALTELPNRSVFNDRLDHAVHKANRNATRLAVFFLDLDHFKHINDSLGHKAGDILLCDVAQRLRSCVREGDTVARLGGDEFTIILEEIRSAQFVAKVADKITLAITKSYMLDGTEVNISPSIGISLFPADGRDVETLIKNADAAMYHAKKNGRNNFQFYSAEMNAQASERLAMETSLRRAVELNEFGLHFQPQINLFTGNIAGAEALLRWTSAQWGDVSPARFVPILEDIGLISEVGQVVLTKACQTYMALKDKLPADFKMAVNLSGRQFHGGQLASSVRQTLFETGMSADNLELEITESILMDDAALAISTLTELSEMGITMAIDDFGTGYSSLSYLKRFPLDVLKIDRSFVRDVNVDSDDAAIVDAILAMSKRLGLDVVAEGVETAEQLAFLQQHECHRVQGYFFSRPLEFEQLSQFVSDKQYSG